MCPSLGGKTNDPFHPTPFFKQQRHCQHFLPGPKQDTVRMITGDCPESDLLRAHLQVCLRA